MCSSPISAFVTTVCVHARHIGSRARTAIVARHSDWEVAVINTKDAHETADVLVALLLREAAVERQGSR
jgi:ERCC4-type nuclease